jgi:hypothetical protein
MRKHEKDPSAFEHIDGFTVGAPIACHPSISSPHKDLKDLNFNSMFDIHDDDHFFLFGFHKKKK